MMLAQSAARAKPNPPDVALLAWYDAHRRALPWRALPGMPADPYAVWLSEVMLQQTTVAAVKDYYQRFLSRWPRVEDLAATPVEEVMREWAGLGYYSRARNLHACAGVVALKYGGQFPRSEAALRVLPGVGPYTAAAIAAIAFDAPAVVVDANVERVVARLFAVEAALPAAKPAIREYAAALTPCARAGDYAQAMMDLGATLCTPKRPACELCPLAGHCAARARGDMECYPRKAAKPARPQRYGAVFYLRRADGHVLVRTRPPKGLLGAMAEFPGSAWTADFDAGGALAAAPMDARCTLRDAKVEHVFTHFALRLAVYVGAASQDAAAPEGCRWVAEAALDKEALPTVMRKVMAVAMGKKLGKRRQ